MTWTTDTPTAEGWYWWRRYDDEPWEVVKLVNDGRYIYHLRAGFTEQIHSSKGEWQGPLVPEEG